MIKHKMFYIVHIKTEIFTIYHIILITKSTNIELLIKLLLRVGIEFLLILNKLSILRLIY